MQKLLRCISILILYNTSIFSQVPSGERRRIFPIDGTSLHYRMVSFSFPESPIALSYGIEIAHGNLQSLGSFNASKLQTRKCNSTTTIEEVPFFGTTYTWRYIYNTAKGQQKSPLYHFSTLSAPVTDTDQIRLRVTKNIGAYKDMYVFVDAAKALFDMNGNPIWFLPENEILLEGNGVLQDLKFTPQGTITFLNNSHFFEISYDGTILTKLFKTDAKGRPSSVGYHHQGSRLKNGHYIVLGNEEIPETEPRGAFSTDMPVTTRATTPEYLNGVYGTLEEFDTKGSLVWQYKTSEYLINAITKNKLSVKENLFLDIHVNAFWLDEEHAVLYMGFKNIDRIFKISYPAGELLEILGGPYTPGQDDVTHNLFCHQHAMITQGNNLFVYNNNDLDSLPVPKIEMFRTTGWTEYGLKPEWEFQFPLRPKSSNTTSGGNVIYLPDGSVFASLSFPYSSIYIVNMNKEIKWESVLEKKNADTKTWVEMPTYRASVITSKSDLNNVIRYGHKK
jgi:hypothetical protein